MQLASWRRALGPARLATANQIESSACTYTYIILLTAHARAIHIPVHGCSGYINHQLDFLDHSFGGIGSYYTALDSRTWQATAKSPKKWQRGQ